MKKNYAVFCFVLMTYNCFADRIGLQNNYIDISWLKTADGWKIERLVNKQSGRDLSWGTADGRYCLLYSDKKPSVEPLIVTKQNGDTVQFLEPSFKNIMKDHQMSVSAVPLNRAGIAYEFYPEKAEKRNNSIVFTSKCSVGIITAHWSLDNKFQQDICVNMSFEPSVDGYFSLTSPTIATLNEEQLKWGVVPGWFQGRALQSEFRLAYLYGQGLPELPIVCRESTLTTLCSVMSANNGTTLSVIPEQGQDRDPYEKDSNTHTSSWRIGLSHMNRNASLCPTVYHPILGESGSLLKCGQRTDFDFRYTFTISDWYAPYQHAIYDIYGLRTTLDLKNSTFSLTDRLHAMHDYVVDDSISLWRVEQYNGIKIGAQSYLGSVVGSDNDAMKNSDVGSVWMMARMTDDPLLVNGKLPYIRNFKLMQQYEDGDEFLSGAAKGQYYLSKSKQYVEEWGSHIEPIALTYYTMIDLGNILLFEPNDTRLREQLRKGADRLCAWQHKDGSFDVAYDKKSCKPIYTDIQDLRPTFYGLLVAYRILGDIKYLTAAEKGAKWYIENAVNKGSFIGVCGDSRFVNDFATGQSAQALLDMYNVTNDDLYKQAAIETAKMYTCSIYTHKTPTQKLKFPKGRQVEDWQISQVGLSFEHGGSTGSAVHTGPVLLSSHCGMFIRMFELTADSLFVDLARAAAIAREAHLNPQNKVSTYYWTQFDRGPGSFPMHAWWQIGWISDYLIAEAEMRSGRKVNFPRGFFTPKVGPQQVLGFKNGTIYGEEVSWVLKKGLAESLNANIDILTMLSVDKNSLYIILLNSSAHTQNTTLTIDLRKTGWDGCRSKVSDLTNKITLKTDGTYLNTAIDKFGIQILKFSQQ